MKTKKQSYLDLAAACDRTIAEAQLHPAVALAAYHNHQWAQLLPTFPLPVPEGYDDDEGNRPWIAARPWEIDDPMGDHFSDGVTIDAIEQAVFTHTEEGPCGWGITSPSIELSRGGMHLVHTTASGRLRWDVGPNGDVRIDVYRPGGLCLSADVASIATRARYNTTPCVSITAWDEPAESRHYAVLAGALIALGQSWVGRDFTNGQVEPEEEVLFSDWVGDAAEAVRNQARRMLMPELAQVAYICLMIGSDGESTYITGPVPEEIVELDDYELLASFPCDPDDHESVRNAERRASAAVDHLPARQPS